MDMSKTCYTIHHENKFLTIPTLSEHLIIGCKEQKKIHDLSCVLKAHRLTHSRWLNKCRMRTRHTLYLCETIEPVQDLNDSSIIDIDLYQLNHDQVELMYGVHNIKLFIMQNFEYNSHNFQPLLSIQGFTLDLTSRDLPYDYEFLRIYLDNIL